MRTCQGRLIRYLTPIRIRVGHLVCRSQKNTDMPNIPHFLKWMDSLWAEKDAQAQARRHRKRAARRAVMTW